MISDIVVLGLNIRPIDSLFDNDSSKRISHEDDRSLLSVIVLTLIDQASEKVLGMVENVRRRISESCICIVAEVQDASPLDIGR